MTESEEIIMAAYTFSSKSSSASSAAELPLQDGNTFSVSGSDSASDSNHAGGGKELKDSSATGDDDVPAKCFEDCRDPAMVNVSIVPKEKDDGKDESNSPASKKPKRDDARVIKSFLSRVGYVITLEENQGGAYKAWYSKCSEAARCIEELDGETCFEDGRKLRASWCAVSKTSEKLKDRAISPVTILSFSSSEVPDERDLKDRFCSCGEITGYRATDRTVAMTFVHFSSALRVVEDIVGRGFHLGGSLVGAQVKGVVKAVKGDNGMFLEKRVISLPEEDSERNNNKRARSKDSDGGDMPLPAEVSNANDNSDKRATGPRLFVSHSKEVASEVLAYLFSNLEGYEFIDVKRNRKTQRLRGFSFVTYATTEYAEAARKKLDGKQVSGSALQIVTAEEENEDRDEESSPSSSSSSHSKRKHKKKRKEEPAVNVRKQRARTLGEAEKGEDDLVHTFRSSLNELGGASPVQMAPMPFAEQQQQYIAAQNYAHQYYPFAMPYPYYAHMQMEQQAQLQQQQVHSPHAPASPMMHPAHIQMPHIPRSPHQTTAHWKHHREGVSPEPDRTRLYCTFRQQLPADTLRDAFFHAAPGLIYISKQNTKNGSQKTYCFVKYGDATAAQLAMLRLNGARVLDQILNVTIAEPPRAHSGVSKRRKTGNSDAE